MRFIFDEISLRPFFCRTQNGFHFGEIGLWTFFATLYMVSVDNSGTRDILRTSARADKFSFLNYKK